MIKGPNDNSNNYILQPVLKFIEQYKASKKTRLHMPGHKGAFGYEDDITEISGADSLYTADGIIAESEQETATLFDTRATFYSTEGSSQVIKAMCYLTLQNYFKSRDFEGGIKNGAEANVHPTILATRNAHKSFIYASMLLGFKIKWLKPEEDYSLCKCKVSPEGLDAAIMEYITECEKSNKKADIAGVYITSPDYLGNILDIRGLADVTHKHDLPLLCDNAHGAYLKFMEPDLHPITLGADLASDSAHKTLPVLTGGAYLHVSKKAPSGIETDAKNALLMFGSTSPSYMIMESLDAAPGRVSPEKYRETAKRLGALKTKLSEAFKEKFGSLGPAIYGDEPLKLCIDMRSCKLRADVVADKLREQNIECEYSDPDFLVTMWTPFNEYPTDYDRFFAAITKLLPSMLTIEEEPAEEIKQTIDLEKICYNESVALYQPYEMRYVPHEEMPVSEELIGKVVADSVISCPPAISPIVAGEVINEETIKVLKYYGVKAIEIAKL